jgi:hypothetical protein
MKRTSKTIEMLTCWTIITFAGAAFGQTALYSNGSSTATDPGLATGPTSASGISAPAGGFWSEVQSDATGGANCLGGLSCHLNGATGSYRFADDFVVPAGPSWSLQTVQLYAYQPDATVSPFSAINVRIWNGPPGQAGSTVVWGDATTNRLTGVTATNIYRIFNSVAAPFPAPVSTNKRIWQLDANVNANLPAGTYWLDWQITSTSSDAVAFTPPVTRANQRTLAGWNGRQFKPVAGIGAWTGAIDPGKPSTAGDVNQDLPFILRGNAGCVADRDDGSGTGTPDGGVGIEDLLYYIVEFDSGAVGADVDDGSGTGTRDGGVGIEDLLYFLVRFDAGC